MCVTGVVCLFKHKNCHCSVQDHLPINCKYLMTTMPILHNCCRRFYNINIRVHQANRNAKYTFGSVIQDIENDKESIQNVQKVICIVQQLSRKSLKSDHKLIRSVKELTRTDYNVSTMLLGLSVFANIRTVTVVCRIINLLLSVLHDHSAVSL